MASGDARSVYQVILNKIISVGPTEEEREGPKSMSRPRPDLSKTLDELEGVAWGPPPYGSYLVTTCHRLRKKPVGQFTVEDLRIMIGQEIGLPFLVPLALEVLEREPLAEGDFYPGDLLKSLLGVSGEFWHREPEWRERLHGVVARVAPVPRELADAVAAFGPGGPTAG